MFVLIEVAVDNCAMSNKERYGNENYNTWHNNFHLGFK